MTTNENIVYFCIKIMNLTKSGYKVFVQSTEGIDDFGRTVTAFWLNKEKKAEYYSIKIP